MAKIKPVKSPLTQRIVVKQQKKSRRYHRIKKKKSKVTVKRELKELKDKAEERRGLIYIGHIPHGFYEPEMKEFFTQFGNVTNLQLCRSRVSGRSKGFGYVEFRNPEVAKIASESMNNYLMFQKRIVSEYIPFEKRPKGLFRGNKTSAENPSVKTRRGKEKFSKNQVKSDKNVADHIKKTVKKLAAQKKKLKGLGISFNLKPVTDV